MIDEPTGRMSVPNLPARSVGIAGRQPYVVHLPIMARTSAPWGSRSLHAIIFGKYRPLQDTVAIPVLLFLRLPPAGKGSSPRSPGPMRSHLSLYVSINMHVLGMGDKRQAPRERVNPTPFFYPPKTTTRPILLTVGQVAPRPGAVGPLGAQQQEVLDLKSVDEWTGYESPRNRYEVPEREIGAAIVPTPGGQPGFDRTDLIPHGGDADVTPPAAERPSYSPNRLYFVPALIASQGRAHLNPPRSGHKDSSHGSSMTFPPRSGLRFLSVRDLRLQSPAPSSLSETWASRSLLRHSVHITDRQDDQWPEPTVVRATFHHPKALHPGTFTDVYYGPEIEQRTAPRRQGPIGSPSHVQHAPTGFGKPDQPLTLRRPPAPATENGHEIGRTHGPENSHGQRPYGPAQDVRHHVQAGEVRLIADTVYRILEKRISIEKERRGLL